MMRSFSTLTNLWRLSFCALLASATTVAACDDGDGDDPVPCDADTCDGSADADVDPCGDGVCEAGETATSCPVDCEGLCGGSECDGLCCDDVCVDDVDGACCSEEDCYDACGGEPEPCEDFLTQERCGYQLGCVWHRLTGRCTATSAPCADFTDLESCLGQGGCEPVYASCDDNQCAI